MLVWQDTFTDVNGTLLTAHTPEVGAGYTLDGGVDANVEIQSNEVASVTVGNNTQRFILDGLTLADGSVTFTVRKSTGTGLAHVEFTALQNDDDNSNVEFLINTDSDPELSIIVNSADSEDSSAFTEFPWVDNETLEIRLVFDSGTYQIWINGVLRLGLSAVAVLPAGYCMLEMRRATTTTVFVDSLSVFSPISEGVKMIALKTGQWNLHREGVALLLAAAGQAICEATAMALTGEVRLWTSANDPGCEDVAADYTEALFSGYSPVALDGMAGACDGILEIGTNPDGIGQVVIDQQTWTVADPATIGETVNGAYLVLIFGGDEFLVATFEFDAPVPMSVADDILKVAGFALLDCQMAPVA